MKIRKAIYAKIDTKNKWTILFYDDEDNLINMLAIPPGKNRIDVYLEIREDNSITRKYFYNYKENIKKLKGEKLIITIIDSKVSLILK